ncbi:hypothetical protein [Paenibacillus sp. 481]|uniref:hypothetical protein n=1 Tax=Paenibacillus sp. 481 TaxID=2835869 RepID=UPI001E365422|nr:hypothetical protein [Paenibacillus sp. 481]UHA72049.1 hypothetical protein KIK04_15185 [Paenibacillus sp. 481]
MINKKLLNNDDLERMMVFKRPVRVVFDDIEEVGLIESHNDTTVKINGSYFMKNSCQFYAIRPTVF